MTIINFHKRFEKQFKKLKKEDQAKVKEKIKIFEIDNFNPILNNHPLSGKFKGYRSINIRGDLRMIYKTKKENSFLFITINNHNNLYK